MKAAAIYIIAIYIVGLALLSAAFADEPCARYQSTFDANMLEYQRIVGEFQERAKSGEAPGVLGPQFFRAAMPTIYMLQSIRDASAAAGCEVMG